MKFRSFLLVLHTIAWLLMPQPSIAYDKTFTSYSESLTRHLISAMRKMQADGSDAVSVCFDCQTILQDRHIYQRALDIDQRLNAYLKMLGHDVSSRQIIEVAPHQVEDVRQVMMNVHAKFDDYALKNNIISAKEIEGFDGQSLTTNGHKRNPYSTLDRIEVLLMELGSPSVQPNEVLHRARIIVQLVKNLCTSEACTQVPAKLEGPIAPKRPIHVYNEVNKLIIFLKRYIDQNNIQIIGDVTVLKPNSNVITPAQVNRLSGVILADLIAINHKLFGPSEIATGNIPLSANPSQVWQQIHYANRLLEKALKQ